MKSALESRQLGDTLITKNVEHIKLEEAPHVVPFDYKIVRFAQSGIVRTPWLHETGCRNDIVNH